MQEVGEGIAREVRRVSQRIEYRPWVELAAVTSELVLGVRKPDADASPGLRARGAVSG